MSKRCRDCYLFETDACACLFYAWEDNIACEHFVDESKLPNIYSERLYEIAYQRGYEKAIDECLEIINKIMPPQPYLLKSKHYENWKMKTTELRMLRDMIEQLKEQK